MEIFFSSTIAYPSTHGQDVDLSIQRFIKQEEQNRGKANWEHLNEELHVLITVEDTRNRAELKIAKAVEEVKKLLVPAVSILSGFLLCVGFCGLFSLVKTITNAGVGGGV
jgi:hypothetical protein